MKLENIGFYTLSDARARTSNHTSPIYRGEMILTDKCNFKCPYCQGIRPDFSGTQPFNVSMDILKFWIDDGLVNVRFSGGEPTLYKDLTKLVSFCKENNVERIAISTNGSASRSLYDELVDAGVNDFSISLDSGCCAIGDKMTGRGIGTWQKVVDNIEYLSQKTYVTVGVVLTDENIEDVLNTVDLASSIGVSDIRIISAAQYNKKIDNLSKISDEKMNKHPILKYRVNNYCNGRNVRGIRENDTHGCPLVLDDVETVNGYHFPCAIYMRQKGNPIGKMNKNWRQERLLWFLNHDTHKDPICKENCLDVCIDFNNKKMLINDWKTFF